MAVAPDVQYPPCTSSPSLLQLELQRESLIADRQQFHKEQLKAQELRSLQSPTLTLAPQTPLQLTPLAPKAPVMLHRDPVEPPAQSNSGGEKEMGPQLLPAIKEEDNSAVGVGVAPEEQGNPTSETSSPQKVAGPALGDTLPIGSLQEGHAMDVTSIPPSASMYDSVVMGGTSVKESGPDVGQLGSETADDGRGSWVGHIGDVNVEQTGSWDRTQTGIGEGDQVESGDGKQTGSGHGDQIGTGDQDNGTVIQSGIGDGELSGCGYPASGGGELTELMPMQPTGSGSVDQSGNVDMSQMVSGSMEQTGSEDMECTESGFVQDNEIEAEQLVEPTGNGNEESGSGDVECEAHETQLGPPAEEETVRGEGEAEGQ